MKIRSIRGAALTGLFPDVLPGRPETKARKIARALAREPLLHFIVAGAALFALNAAFPSEGAGTPGPAGAIRLGEGDVAWLVETWTRQWRRPPSQAELRGLVADYVKEEMLSREAREMRDPREIGRAAGRSSTASPPTEGV